MLVAMKTRLLAMIGAALRGGLCGLGCALAACSPSSSLHDTVGQIAYQRQGDEIMVAGQLFHTGAPVVLWFDPSGYDAYRVEKRFGPIAKASWEQTKQDGNGPDEPVRYNTRFFRFVDKQPEPMPGTVKLTAEQIAKYRGGGWDLAGLQQVVDQFVLHYDVCGTSRTCFRVLHDQRGLSVHFMLDIDGTIYQTLDLKERAWHATVSNDRSVGIEIANMGAYAIGERDACARWDGKDALGQVRITVPDDQGDGGVRTPNFVGYPDRQEIVIGGIGNRALRQYDLTPQQYESLTRLTAALHKALPKIRLDAPRDKSGEVSTQYLSDNELKAFTGVLGHFHIQADKADPGPALQWERVLEGARTIVYGHRESD